MRSRTALVFLVFGTVTACGVFGSTDETPPSDPSQPPIAGTPIEGVFVSSRRGTDDGDGSEARPLKSIAAAIARANEIGMRVIVCAERYDETLTLVDGVSMYGMYNCPSTGWVEGTNRAEIVAPSRIAVTAKDISKATRMQGFTIKSADVTPNEADAAARTSIGVYVENSKGLIFDGVGIIAGNGGDGIDGAPSIANVEQNQNGGGHAITQTGSCPLPAQDCSTKRTPGGLPGTSSCLVGPSGGAGGYGGDGAKYVNGNLQGLVETRGFPLAASATTAIGGNGGSNGTVTGYGSGGAYGAHGGDGAHGQGIFRPNGYVPGDGSKGSNGNSGQGGGGGGGNDYYMCNPGAACGFNAGTFWSSSGGGGGAGGCPGIAGEPGKGGGASIGMFVVNSAITISRSRIASGSGGRAGLGTLGGFGLLGGNPGNAAAFSGGGGRGGDGGMSGLSGHGAPGPSVAIAFAGARPEQNEVELAPGAGGSGAAELRKGSKVLNAVSAGESTPELAISPQ